MRHLLRAADLTRTDVEALLSRAAALQDALAKSRPPHPLSGRIVANLFFENSTRTRMSFERAAKALGAEVLNFAPASSSVTKGETLLDTVLNVDALGPIAIVIRHGASGAAALVAKKVRAAVINGGDGTHEHPSQALLDAFTLREKLGSLEGKRVAIVGDILFSRVARSNIHILKLLGASVVVSGPPTLLPMGVAALGCDVTPHFDSALEGADAVMMLRVQLERQAEAFFPSAREYARYYGLNSARAARLKDSAVVLHPGPMNRGVEIAPDVADGTRSLILGQVANGVAMRMAILEWCS